MYLTPEEEAKKRKEESKKYAPLTGSFFRKLHRANTVHFTGTCPKCGRENLVYTKDLKLKHKTWVHNVWVCKKCKSYFKKDEINNGHVK